jgi:hypothetical protein
MNLLKTLSACKISRLKNLISVLFLKTVPLSLLPGAFKLLPFYDHKMNKRFNKKQTVKKRGHYMCHPWNHGISGGNLVPVLLCWPSLQLTKCKLRGMKPASELYQPSDRRLSANLVPTFADIGCCVISAMDPHGHILGFLDRNHYYFFQVTPQLYTQGWVDPISDSLLLRKSGSAGNRTRDLWICSQ